MGDFGAMHVWHPWATRPSRLMATDSRTPGARRVQQIIENGEIQDRLIEWDGTRKTLRYATDSTTLPVTNFESTLSVTNNLDGTSTVTWLATYEAAEGAATADATAAVEDFLRVGLQGIVARVR